MSGGGAFLYKSSRIREMCKVILIIGDQTNEAYNKTMGEDY
jgi:hypothetical protein